MKELHRSFHYVGIDESDDFSLFDGCIFVDLQWFAAEDEGRTEDPTDYKIRKAREEGRVAKSQDLNSALVVLFPVIILLISSAYIFRSSMDIIRFFYERCTTESAFNGAWFGIFLSYFFRTAVPITITALTAGVAANLVQNKGFIFSTKPIEPNFSKISPNFIKFFKRTLFSAEGLFNLTKSLVKVVCIAVIGYIIIKNNIPKLLSLLEADFAKSVFFVAGLAAKILVTASVFFIIFGIPDYFFQKKQFIESLKMSKYEIKEEFKQMEGNPVIKSKIRQRMQAILSQNLVKTVPEADVVITNPTHYAVAVKYDNTKMSVPIVTAKGADAIAQRIKKIAGENKVPIVENKPLARALYANVDLGAEIPSEYLQAIALILFNVYKMDPVKRAQYSKNS